VAITWERVLATNFPHKIQVWTSRKKTYIYIATILIFFAAINFHWFFSVKLFVYEDGSRGCDAVSEAWEYYSYFIFSYIDLAKYVMLPFLAIAIGNILIIRRIIYAKRMARQQLNVSNANSSQISSITFMLVGISVIFLVLNLPVAVVLILEETAIEFNDYQYAWLSFVSSIAHLMMYTNNAVNFYLYCLTGSRFRNEARAVLCKKSGDNINTGQPASQTATTSIQN